jgi:hypothetical protein
MPHTSVAMVRRDVFTRKTMARMVHLDRVRHAPPPTPPERQDLHFLAPPLRHFGSVSASRRERRPSSSARRRIPISLRPLDLEHISSLRSIQYRQNGARTCTYLALLRRSADALKKDARGARKRRKTLAYTMRSRLESSILRPTCRRTPLPAAEETRALLRRVLRSPRRYGYRCSQLEILAPAQTEN